MSSILRMIAQRERQVGVHTRGDTADETRTQQQAVRRDLGVGGIVAERRHEQIGQPHRGHRIPAACRWPRARPGHRHRDGAAATGCRPPGRSGSARCGWPTSIGRSSCSTASCSRTCSRPRPRSGRSSRPNGCTWLFARRASDPRPVNTRALGEIERVRRGAPAVRPAIAIDGYIAPLEIEYPAAMLPPASMARLPIHRLRVESGE